MMLHIRFHILTLAFIMILLCFSGCTSESASGSEKNRPQKIADNLYEITYSAELDWDDSFIPDLSGFSCSGIQNGPYRGRNYDWNYADTDLCVIHAAANENRPHASVGVADMSFILNEDGTCRYESLPFVTVDGINDAGVCIQVNVMPYGENGALVHTETKEDDLPGAGVVRYVLDRADSVEAALAFLSEKDIFSEVGTAEEVHWMISGPASSEDRTIKTAVLEIFPDGQHITRDFVDDKPIMTNFNLSNFDGTPASVGIGAGYERWEILNQFFDQADSVMGTFDLMEKVFFTKMYDLYSDSFWYSEYNGTNLSNYRDEAYLKEALGEDAYRSYMENYGSVYYTSALWDGEKAIYGDISKTGSLAPVVASVAEKYNAQPTDGSLWITIHTSVYDLEHLTLDIQVRESQDHLHFTID